MFISVPGHKLNVHKALAWWEGFWWPLLKLALQQTLGWGHKFYNAILSTWQHNAAEPTRWKH